MKKRSSGGDEGFSAKKYKKDVKKAVNKYKSQTVEKKTYGHNPEMRTSQEWTVRVPRATKRKKMDATVGGSVVKKATAKKVMSKMKR